MLGWGYLKLCYTGAMIKLKRVYQGYDKEDGFRILVDRLWPRGLSKNKAHVDLWLKEVAPSTELRQWFNHDPQKWQSFQKKYATELEGKKESLEQLKTLYHQHPTITLLYGAKDEEHNQAVALQTYLKHKL